MTLVQAQVGLGIADGSDLGLVRGLAQQRLVQELSRLKVAGYPRLELTGADTSGIRITVDGLSLQPSRDDALVDVALAYRTGPASLRDATTYEEHLEALGWYIALASLRHASSFLTKEQVDEYSAGNQCRLVGDLDVAAVLRGLVDRSVAIPSQGSLAHLDAGSTDDTLEWTYERLRGKAITLTMRRPYGRPWESAVAPLERSMQECLRRRLGLFSWEVKAEPSDTLPRQVMLLSVNDARQCLLLPADRPWEAERTTEVVTSRLMDCGPTLLSVHDVFLMLGILAQIHPILVEGALRAASLSELTRVVRHQVASEQGLRRLSSRLESLVSERIWSAGDG